MRKHLFAVIASTIVAAAVTIAAEAHDPFLWLEELEGDKALTWVRTQNDRSLKSLQSDPRYKVFESEALAILEAKDRIPIASFHGDKVAHFWRDETNIRGLWRSATLESYLSGTPTWETVLDLDELARTESKNWVYQSANCLEPEQDLCLLRLSDGGTDAAEIREFNFRTKNFVDAGFVLPPGKQVVNWIDTDTLIVGREWEPGELTPSGYPFILKRWRRGDELIEAREAFRGKQTDVMCTSFPLADSDGSIRGLLFVRHVTGQEREFYLETDSGPKRLPIPLNSSVRDFFDGQIIISLDDDWTWNSTEMRAGSLVSFSLDEFVHSDGATKARIIFSPNARQSVGQVVPTRNRLLVAINDNMNGTVYSFSLAQGVWRKDFLKLPMHASISVYSARREDDKAFVRINRFLEPSSLYIGDAVSGEFTKFASQPARFEASQFSVEQHEALSTDRVKIPYFVVFPRDIRLNGQNPTLLHAYGGFKQSMLPSYLGITGKLWLERGGIYVLANIRGGGEFGPAWHEAGLKTKRQLVFDDFTAVARDLIKRKVTSPRRLGIDGSSNGGLLMGVQLTQHPELWNAVLIGSPLLDMVRFSELGAGASWIAEYGDPKHPVEGTFLKKMSPYHNLKRGVKYPEPFFVTASNDDRVHPGHARKMAAKMQALNLPFLFYENIDGGHASATNARDVAKLRALEFTYLSRKLMH